MSRLLVLAQFTLIALIVSPAGALVGTSARSLVGLTLVALSVLLALWSLRMMKSGTFSVMPTPTAAGELTTTGPYAYVRHPMYSAVMLACTGVAISHSLFINWIFLACLIGVLMAKIRLEEALLTEQYTQYQSYKQHTRRLIPFVY